MVYCQFDYKAIAEHELNSKQWRTDWNPQGINSCFMDSHTTAYREEERRIYRGGRHLNPVGTRRNQLLHDSQTTEQREMWKNMEEEDGKTTPVEIEINKESAAAWILTEQERRNVEGYGVGRQVGDNCCQTETLS
ncbi:hypothetical protein MUK42_35847 [Musa troglodytarum]|uniref:Uncharacterized protein n=1 Tax=Musa troglodytarum TaxID=320322 RepID=A0A9E7EBU9_9LILI|nr:hypothetical protein MUK42_35847 [Musa troglodytarum]